MMFTTNCVEKPIRSCLERLGRFVGQHPLWFIIAPLFLSATFGVGFYFLEDRKSNDIVEQFTPRDGRAKIEKQFFETFFRPGKDEDEDDEDDDDDDMFSTLRLTTDGSYASVIFSSEINAISPHALEEILHVDTQIKTMTVRLGGEEFSYTDVCAGGRSSCHDNTLLKLLDYNASRFEVINLTYPVHRDSRSGPVHLGHLIGRVEVDENRTVQCAKAVRLFYYLRQVNSTLEDAWLNEFVSLLSNKSTSVTQTILSALTFSRSLCSNLMGLIQSVTCITGLDVPLTSVCPETCLKQPSLLLHTAKTIKIFNPVQLNQVSYFTSISRQQEFEKSTESVTQLFSITYCIAILFSVLSCIRLDSVRNKVWVAFLGVVSTGLAVLSSFGLLLLMDVPFVITVASSPFLVLGIGMDDMFIMISCWQQTAVQDGVPERLAATYREAAISITITTLTDVLAFYLSYGNPFPSVQSFCLYAGTAILFCYLYNVSFFGACLALNGEREESNRHWWTCMKVPEERPAGASKGYAVCCVGGAYDGETGTEEEHWMTMFFRKFYGPVLTSGLTKALVGVLYLGYVSVSVYGCTTMKEGIELKNLAVDQSYVVKYYEDEQTFFGEYGPNVMLALNGTFQYWNRSERAQLEFCIGEFQDLPFVGGLTTSWLHSFERYARGNDLDVSSEVDFMEHLYVFLHRNPVFSLDVSLANDTLLASRLFLQTVNVSSEKTMLQSLRKTAQSCPLPLVVYHPAFIYYDQYTVITSNTIQTVSIATGVMLIVALILIPSPVCALWVTFAIASVIVGVAGFMALLGINLDSISMINLVISIGFSVDFSAHISYAFVSSGKPSANEKAVDALAHLGYPILQGALSTILGVVVLSASVSYIFRTFFTIMFLVIWFGLLHGVVFIPVFLTLAGFCTK